MYEVSWLSIIWLTRAFFGSSNDLCVRYQGLILLYLLGSLSTALSKWFVSSKSAQTGAEARAALCGVTILRAASIRMHENHSRDSGVLGDISGLMGEQVQNLQLIVLKIIKKQA